MHIRRLITNSFALYIVITMLSACSFITFVNDDALIEDTVRMIAKQNNSNKTLHQLKKTLQLQKEKYQHIRDKIERNEHILQGVLASLSDKHAKYFSPDEWNAFSQLQKGKFAGIGMRFIRDETSKNIHIIHVFPNSPAEKYGLKEGDIITHLDHLTVSDIPTNKEITQYIRGEIGTAINLKIQGKRDTIRVIRNTFVVKHVVSVVDKYDIVHITIHEFMDKTADQIHEAIKNAHRQLGHKPKGYIIDVRNNPGGTLQSGVHVAEIFLHEGKKIVASNRSDIGGAYLSTTNDAVKEAPIVVLINKHSASSSEIFSGALQDHRRAILLGEKSRGKGSAQRYKPLRAPYGAIKFTIIKYVLPNGSIIDGIGLQPDIYEKNKDMQIQRAVDFLLQ